MRTAGRWKLGRHVELERVASGFIVSIGRVRKKEWEVCLHRYSPHCGPVGPLLTSDVLFSRREAMIVGTGMLRGLVALERLGE